MLGVANNVSDQNYSYLTVYFGVHETLNSIEIELQLYTLKVSLSTDTYRFMKGLNMSTQLENETQALLGKVVQDFTGAIATRMCAIGIDLGLFVDLAENGASTSQEIAERKSYQERYIREWVYGTHKVGYLNFDKETRKASLSKAAINVLVS